MLGQKPPIIIVYIDRERLQFYGGSLSAIPALEMQPVVIRDLEVVNRDALYALVNQWLKQNNLGSNRLFFILSPTVYFEKVLTATGESEQETEILAFYDSVPFEELTTRVLIVDGKKHAFAANRNLLEALRHAFILQGLRVIGVVPAFLLGTVAAKRWLDAEMGAYVLKHFDMLRQQNIIDTEEQNQSAPAQVAHVPTTKSNPRLMIMVGIFGVLLLVLIFFLFTQR